MQNSKKLIMVVAIAIIILVLVTGLKSSLLFRSTTSNGSYSSYQKSSGGAGFGATSFEMSDSIAPGTPAVTVQKAENDIEINTKNISENRLIIKNGSMSIVVKNVQESAKAIGEFATKNGGFVVYSNIYKNDIAPVAEVRIRIPVEKFDSGISEIKKFGEVKSESVDGQDVTEEYVDLESQLKNLKATENQFLAIMAKAEKITDILAVQNELKRVRSEIETITGRMKYLEKSAAMSTLSVSLSSDPDALPTFYKEVKWKPLGVLKSAVRTLVEVGKYLVNFAIWLVVFIPVWILIIIGYFVGRKIYRKIKVQKK